MGDRSRLRDTLADRDRIALETYRDARAAMALIREAVEDCAPPGSVTREGYLTPEFTVEAEALVRGKAVLSPLRPYLRRPINRSAPFGVGDFVVAQISQTRPGPLKAV
jgi:hypothetical protein